MVKRSLILCCVLLGLAVACGGSESGSTGAAVGETTVDVTMGQPDEYSMKPAVAKAPAGTITFTVHNDGTIKHEMVVIKTDKDAGDLAEESGEADETGAVDEVVLGAGEAEDLTLNLEPGHYALVCNLPGHYQLGMYANFEVT